jgi:hypothetical protein
MAYTIPTREELHDLLDRLIVADEKLKTRPRHYVADLYVSGSGGDGLINFSHKMPHLLSAFNTVKDACLLFQNIQREDKHSTYSDYVSEYNKSKGLRGNL